MNREKNIDQDNLINILDNFPNQLTEGWRLAENISFKKKFNTIVLNGMGGSALVGELLNIYLVRNRLPITLFINRNYNLTPISYQPNVLNIFSSYSGNTEETLASFREARRKNLFCLGIGSGGKLIAECRQRNIPYIIMPEGIQPRMTIGYSFGALLRVIRNADLIKDPTTAIRRAKSKINAKKEVYRKIGKRLAEKIKGKTPVIYAPESFKALSQIWKIMFNENSKTPAFWNYFPELNHNEMVGFTKPQARFHLIMLRDRKDHPQNLKRFAVTERVLAEKGIESSLVDIPLGETIFRIFGALQIGCYASYYLAINYKIDPTPVELVEIFKKML